MLRTEQATLMMQGYAIVEVSIINSLEIQPKH